uniref:Large ribosomal subunit protein uL22c n=8 Tax=Endiandra TaxID=128617 RepID=A0A190LKZ7_9MAGN|nr:ribosomal protein L22 [Endiandra microneura]YP_009970335.1 ribosomal protein L22 [Endiandra montana]YP_009970418.1 ribosomal protein L22 [Endiandra xanthocarpa]ALT16948.1 ribosomal protein L22 [Endiandra globosa]ALT17032.1 ribosomal protein L22 [Endiandra discolor]QNE87442.1 ribosomal protein L22 [Endiandra monothyra subsp. monothyra]QWL20628.1 ribosomal protein L22 [Endiandra dolichocarpa]QWL23236.1 ribosomal protein L22 [Endiandra sp. C40]
MSKWRKWKKTLKKQKMKRSSSTQVQALAQHVSMSAHKARRVIDQIRGQSYEKTLMLLELMPYRAFYPIFKLVYSAAANASHNKSFNEADSVISKAEVHGGTIVKKFKPRARGRSYPIERLACHIIIVLKDRSKKKTDQDIFLETKNVWRDPIIERYIEKEREREKKDGSKNKSTWFPTWGNPKSSFPLVRTTKKLLHRSPGR